MLSFINMKRYLFFVVLSVYVAVVAMAFVNKDDERPAKHLEVVLRTIGHEVLLHSKDSTSRVLPVTTVNDNTYRISFENSFGFTPDTLMKLVHQQLAKHVSPANYIVSVNDCYRNQTIFAYEVNTSSGDLKPCRGREQQKGCYVIEISFPEKRSRNYGMLVLAIIPLALGGFYFIRRRPGVSTPPKPAEERITESLSNRTEPVPGDTDHQKLGIFLFSESKAILSLHGEEIELSVKEAKALSILASKQNQVVERTLLMKEIWEDDGVVVITRNVDVLISKLRKKLSADPAVRIANVHGKGYRLIV
jgi:hypothetical protein